MPQQPLSIPLPQELLEALDRAVDSGEQPKFVAEAVARALVLRRLTAECEDPGIEPWWPIDDADFLMLSSGEFWLAGEE